MEEYNKQKNKVVSVELEIWNRIIGKYDPHFVLTLFSRNLMFFNFRIQSGIYDLLEKGEENDE